MTDIQRVVAKNFSLKLKRENENEYFALFKDGVKYILFLLQPINKVPPEQLFFIENYLSNNKVYLIFQYNSIIVLKNSVFSLATINENTENILNKNLTFKQEVDFFKQLEEDVLAKISNSVSQNIRFLLFHKILLN